MRGEREEREEKEERGESEKNDEREGSCVPEIRISTSNFR